MEFFLEGEGEREMGDVFLCRERDLAFVSNGKEGKGLFFTTGTEGLSQKKKRKRVKKSRSDC